MNFPAKQIEDTAEQLIKIARLFADRQNADSTLTAREAGMIVNAALNGGNVLQQVARELKEKE